MNEIVVEIVKNETDNVFELKLWDRYIVCFGKIISSNWMYGVNINTIILDINDQFILENIEVIWRQDAWKVEDDIFKPKIKYTGDLKVNPSSIQHKEFDYPNLIAVTNKDKSVLIVLFEGTNNFELDGCLLSTQCVALLRNKTLKGFYFYLKDQYL